MLGPFRAPRHLQAAFRPAVGRMREAQVVSPLLRSTSPAASRIRHVHAGHSNNSHAAQDSASPAASGMRSTRDLPLATPPHQDKARRSAKSPGSAKPPSQRKQGLDLVERCEKLRKILWAALNGGDFQPFAGYWKRLRPDLLAIFSSSSAMNEMHHTSLVSGRLRYSFHKLHGDDLDAVEDFLAHFAALGLALGANVRLEYLIERKDLDTALAFSSRIADVVVALNAESNPKAGQSTATGSTSSRPTDGPRELGLKPPLMAHIITACIMKETFRPLLRHDLAYVATGFRFENLQIAVAASADQFKLPREQHLAWAERCRTLGVVALPIEVFQGYLRHDIYRPGRIDAVQLARSIVQELEDAEPCITVEDPIAAAEHVAVNLSGAHWAYLAKHLIQSGDADVATTLCEALERVVSRTPPQVHAALIEGFAAVEQFDRVRDCWTAYTSQPGAPDADVYQAYIDALLNKGLQEDALAALEPFTSENAPGATFVFNTVLRWLVRESRADEARALLERMENAGPTPNTASYNTFLCETTDHYVIAGVLRAMDERGVPADTTTAALLLAAGHPTPEQAPAFALDCLQKTQHVDLGVCEDVLWRLMQLDDDGVFDAARTLLAHMPTYSPALAPTLDTYVMVLSRVERRTWRDAAAAERHRLALMEKVDWRRFPAEWVATTKYLIRACCLNPAPDAMQHAMRYYREYLRALGSRRTPHWIVWGTLMSELLRRKEYGDVAWIIDDINAEKLSPSLQALLDEAQRNVPEGSKIEQLVRRRIKQAQRCHEGRHA